MGSISNHDIKKMRVEDLPFDIAYVSVCERLSERYWQEIERDDDGNFIIEFGKGA